MKKVFGFILIGLGVIVIFKMFSSGDFKSGYEIIGGLIGIILVTFLPGYFLIRNKKKFHDADSKEETK